MEGVPGEDRRLHLRQLNAAAWKKSTDVFPTQENLDSSLKRNTGFIRRLRLSLNAENQAGLVSDIGSLSLEKYLQELTSAVCEGLLKCKVSADIDAAVEVISALHERFNWSFTPHVSLFILENIQPIPKSILAAMPPDQSDKEFSARLSKQRALIRIAIELWLVGILRTTADVTQLAPDNSGISTPKKQSSSSQEKRASNVETEIIPIECLNMLLLNDKDFDYLPLAVTVVKHFGKLLGLNSIDDVESNNPYVGVGVRKKFYSILFDYNELLQLYILKESQSVNRQVASNQNAFIRTGMILEDRQAQLDNRIKALDKLTANARTLAEGLGLNLVNVDNVEQDISGDEPGTENGITTNSSSTGQKKDLWNDEDERRFYEDIIDLQTRVDPQLLASAQQQSRREAVNKDTITQRVIQEFTQRSRQSSSTEKDQEDKPPSLELSNDQQEQQQEQQQQQPQQSGASKARLDAILIRLKDLPNREMIDEIAVDFAQVNSKHGRNRLLLVLADVPPNRQDVIPYYARLTAILSRYYPQIADTLVSYLDDKFRYLQRRKKNNHAGLTFVRSGNVKYLGELTKFGLVPSHVILHTVKMLVEELNSRNVDNLCTLLESCGRYLARKSETKEVFDQFLEIAKRKRSDLDYRERSMLDNALFYVDPPEIIAIEKKQRPIVEKYIIKLIYHDLNEKNINIIINKLRKLDWKNHDTIVGLRKVFTKVWKVQHTHLPLIARIVKALSRYHGDFGIFVVDDVIHQIVLGIETNIFSFNQRRIAQVLYLAHLYVQGMIESSKVMLDTMYTIISAGYPFGRPSRESFNPLDVPDDYFRVRLITTILQIAGKKLSQESWQELELFERFFQYYYRCKIQPPSMDIEFAMSDVLDVVPWVDNNEIAQDYESAVESLMRGMTTTDQSQASIPQSKREPSPSPEPISVSGDRFQHSESQEYSRSRKFDYSAQLEAERMQQLQQERERERERKLLEEQRLAEELEFTDHEGDFDRDLARMINEGINSRQFEKVSDGALPLPGPSTSNSSSNNNNEDDGQAVVSSGGSDIESGGKMKFRFLNRSSTRKNIQIQQINVPSDSVFAISVSQRKQAQANERAQLKRFILDFERGKNNNDSASHDGGGGDIMSNANHIYRQQQQQEQESQESNNTFSQAVETALYGQE